MPITTIKELLEAGVHFGTKTSLWHPKMAPFIFGARNGIHIIDLRETAKALIQAHYFFSKLARAGKNVLFVGTKRQAREVIREAALSVGMPYVIERWLGGTLTNQNTIRASIKRLDDIESGMTKLEWMQQPKKAQARAVRERKRIVRNLEGLRILSKLPDALFIIDPTKDVNAVREARRLDIPVVALVDTDADPEKVNLPIPGNDDGIRSIRAVMKVVVEAIKQGRAEHLQRGTVEEAPAPAAPVAPPQPAATPAAETPTPAPTAASTAEGTVPTPIPTTPVAPPPPPPRRGPEVKGFRPRGINVPKGPSA